MVPEPLHPALVHFPIVLVVILPIAAIVSLMIIRRGTPSRRSWVWVVAVAGLLFATSWLAVQTGEAQEERVEEVVPESAIDEHEEAAETFLILSGFGVLVLAAGLAKGRVGLVARYVGTAAAVFLVTAGYRVGTTGGRLVYEHGAAQAYVQADATGSSPLPGRERDDDEGRERDDDEEREGRGERR